MMKFTLILPAVVLTVCTTLSNQLGTVLSLSRQVFCRAQQSRCDRSLPILDRTRSCHAQVSQAWHLRSDVYWYRQDICSVLCRVLLVHCCLWLRVSYSFVWSGLHCLSLASSCAEFRFFHEHCSFLCRLNTTLAKNNFFLHLYVSRFPIPPLAVHYWRQQWEC